MRTLFFALTLLALLSVGCSTAVSPDKAAHLNLEKTGLLLATVSRTNASDDLKYIDVELMLTPVNHADTAFKNASITGTEGPCLVEVPPGRYRFGNWQVAGGTAGADNIEHEFEFDVAPGQVTYIGHVEISVTGANVGVGTKSWVNVRERSVLRNRYDEAVAAFRQSYPTLAAIPIRNVAPRELTMVRSPAPPAPYVAIQTKEYEYGAPPPPTGPKWP
ncbi:MAG TPA: hypothetical protein VFJ90_09035 [Candidatus Didemnitutus sp.]|nr:hypothetical protein [Candidatus Didemnitutus sp.]